MAAVLVAALVWPRRPSVSPLPAAVHYATLPARFNQSLAAAQAAVRATGSDPAEVRKLARLYLANGLYAEAKACFRFLASSAGGLAARDHYYLATIAQNENDLERAQSELRAVLQTEPAYVPARLALAEALFKTGRENEAAAEYAAVLAVEANQPQASLGLVRLALQRGDDDAAVAGLEGLMAHHPESTSGAALFAQILGRRGETERAAAMTQWSRQKHEPIPPDPWMEAVRADCYDLQRLSLAFEEYLMAGQMEPALPLLARVEELDPKSWTPQLLRGWSNERANHHLEAAQEYRLALAKGGDPERVCPLLAAALRAGGQPAEAAALLAEYHAKLPASIPILLAYADVAVQQGDENLARTLLTKVLAVEPYLYTPNMNLAKILWTKGEQADAVRCLQRIVKVFPVDVASRGLLGQYYLEKSDPVAAIPPLEQALAHVEAQTPAAARLTAMLGTAYLQAGSAEAENGRFAEAVQHADQAIRLAPDEPKAYALKANGCVQLKQFRPAAGALEKMAALQPDNPTIQLSLGDVIYQDGQPDQARPHWQKAQQLAAADDAELRNALALRLAGHISPETFQ